MDRVAHRVRVHLVSVTDPEGPSEPELAAIEAEWPLIQAELDLVDAECAVAAAPRSEVAWRAHRRATRRVLAVAARMASSPDTPQEVA